MRAYPIHELNFLETVQIYFLEVTGKGVVLGSRDAELLQAWRAEGASAASVCQGIDDAVRARTELPRSIAGCRKWIEPRVEAARAVHVGAHGDAASSDSEGATDATADAPQRPAQGVGAHRAQEWANEALDSIAQAGEATERESFKEAYRAAYRSLREAIARDAELAQALLGVEEELATSFFGALDDQERARFEDDFVVQSRLDAMGVEARARYLAACQRRYLEQTYGLISVFR